jgi:ubiquinone/menaquinone biosynthesis C-methylase UbiE
LDGQRRMTNPYDWVTKNHMLKKKRDLEELQTDSRIATSANSFSWITKGNITMEFARDAEMVLDVGCGWGRELIRLKNAIGIDMSLPFLKTARNYVKNDVVLADVHHLPFKRDSFEFIVTSEVLEHVENAAQVIKELKRVMKPKGRLLIQTPNKALTFGRLISSEKCGHVQEFKFQELKNMLESSGFFVLRRTGSTIPYIPSTSRFEKLNENALFFSMWKLMNRTIPVKWDMIVLSELAENNP